MKDELITKKLILENDWLIKSVASLYCKYSSFEDLYQNGVIGLLKAKNNFDSTKGVKFSTFAYTYVKGEMLKFMMNDKSLKVNKEYLKLYKAYNKSKEFLTQKLGKIPTLTEISLFMNVEEKVLEDTFMACDFVLSLDQETNTSTNYYEIVGGTNIENYEEKVMLKESLKYLNSLEKELINCRYYKDYTQSETAQHLNISQVQVSRLEKKSIDKIRQKIA